MVKILVLLLSALLSARMVFEPLRPVQMPTDEVASLYQDTEGYIWIVTYSGLVRYDGYQAQLYTLGDDEPLESVMHRVIEDGEALYVATEHGLLRLDRAAGELVRLHDSVLDDVNISTMTTDKDGRLWVGGDQGMFLKNSDGRFSPVRLAPGPREKAVTDIVDMLVDSQGDLWFTSWGRGLFRYDIEQSKLHSYTEGDLGQAYVLHQDRRGGLWVGTWGNGLLYIPDIAHPEAYRRFRHETARAESILDDIIYDIDESPSGSIWIGSRSGLSILENPEEDRFANRVPETGVGKLPFNEVNAILCTRDETMWLGMLGGGVCKVNNPQDERPEFPMERVLAECKTSSVRSLCRADSSRYWLGIAGHGMIRYSRPDGNFVNYSNLPQFNGLLYTSTVDCIIPRGEDQLCFGSYDSGIWVYDKEKDLAWALNSTNCREMTDDCIRALREDSAGNVWIGTRKGVFILRPDDSIVSLPTFLGNPDLDNQAKVVDIAEDKDGNIWLATGYDGIMRVSPARGDCRIFADDLVRTSTAILADSHGAIWAGTPTGGLCRYDARRDRFVREEGLVFLENKDITNLAEDPHGRIWTTTSNAVLSFLPGAEEGLQVVSYRSLSDQQEPAFFNRNVSLYLPDIDAMAFGTSRGVRTFPCRPEPADSAGRRQIAVTGILPGPDMYQDRDIRFSIFDFQDPSSDIYCYRLYRRGRTPGSWKVTGGGNNTARFTGLRAGTYCFEVYGFQSGESGHSPVKTLELKINGNPWLSWWAILLYILAGGGILYALFTTTASRFRMRRQMELDSLNQQKADEINQARLQFFTNVSHEFLTPLSIILASVESLEAKTPHEKGIIDIMSSNAIRLTRMVQQVLDFRKAESDNLKLKVSENDIAQFIGHEVEAFIPLVRKHGLSVAYSSDPQHFRGWFDPDKLDKIVYNLLSNAVKYTPQGGTVRLSVSRKEDGWLEVSCINSGKLMSGKTIAGLFKRFYEGDYRSFNTIGNGIGLSLVKSLVTLHKGSIDVVSNEQMGNCFTVRIPIGREAYGEDEIDEGIRSENNMPLALRMAENSVKTEYTVLCIDDNEELCELFHAILSKNFTVLTCHSAEAALELLPTQRVDVIVCDVAMPGMDGLQFCAHVKKQVEYSHIPVILLTAKTDDATSIGGFQAGADGYLTKPCNYSVLTAMILNLLGKQEQKSEDFRKQLVFEVRDIDYTSVDKQFLQHAIDVVNEHIADSEFSQTDFVQAMNVSRTVLTEKLKNLTGFTPSAFILNARLTLAYKLLSEEKGNIRVSDLAYSVGFSDAKYFSKCFKAKYKKTPKNIMEEHRI
ncbi:MAG: response regulator [Bacteroidales bacterium]|nr:response regulator [Bacteroidales bacterium]